MPKTKRVGRPTVPKSAAKGRIVPVRFTANHLRAIEAAAKANNVTVSEWIRRTVDNAIQQ
jgi:ribosomal protein L28